MQGYLSKTGPSPKDVYKKRWCTLEGRKLMYHVDMLAAYPKGEVFLGHTSSGFLVVHGFGPGFREQGFGFILHTPERAYQFSAETEGERAEWTRSISGILETQLMPQV